MTVRKRGDTYTAIVRVIGHAHEYKTFALKSKATEWKNDRIKALKAKTISDPTVKLDVLFEKYVNEIAPKRGRAASHLSRDVPTVRKHFGTLVMSDLDGTGLITHILKKSTTPQFNGQMVSGLFGMLGHIEAHWNIKVPWTELKAAKKRLTTLGYIKRSESRDRRVSDAELAAIKAALPGGTHRAYVVMLDFLMASAMRVSEACRIRWSDVNEEARTIVIRDRKHPTKKFGNHQTVPLVNGAFEILMTHKAKRIALLARNKYGKKGVPFDTDIIFNRAPPHASRVFHAAAEEAGVKDVVLHDLRHEGISRLFEAGFQIPEVSLVSGHSDWKQLRRYTSLRPTDMVAKEARMKLAA